MKKLKQKIFMLGIIFFSIMQSAYSQYGLDWHTYYANPNQNASAFTMGQDNALNTYIGGDFNPSGSTYLMSIVKINPSGSAQWEATYNGVDGLHTVNHLNGMAVDPFGNTYMIGTSDTVGGGDAKCVIVKWNTSGTFEWINVPNNMKGINAIVIDISGNIIVAGYSVYATIDSTLTGTVIKYNGNGNHLWTKELLDTGSVPDALLTGTLLNDLSVDANGNIYTCGYDIGWYGSFSSNAAGYTAKLDGSGTKQWSKNYPNIGFNFYKISLDNSYNIYVYGECIGCPSFEALSYTNNGIPRWTLNNLYIDNWTSTGGGVIKYSYMTVDGNGNTYFPSGGYIAKINSLGTYASYSPGITAKHLSIDNTGNIYCLGDFDISAKTVSLSKVNAAGTILWTQNNVKIGGGINTSDWGNFMVDANAKMYLRSTENNSFYLAKIVPCASLTCNFTATTTITNANSACTGGKIKLNLSGSFHAYPTLKLYDVNSVLLSTIDLAAGTPNYTFTGLVPGSYTVIINDNECCQQTKTAVVKCAAPSTSLTTSNITGSGAKLNWGVSACAVGYKVQYRVQGTLTWTTTSIATNTGFKSLTGLLPLTTYEWHVATKCSNFATAVYSGYSATQTFTTTCLCVIPAAITVTNIAQTTAKINWSGSACAYQYRIQYRKQGVATWTTKYAIAPLLTKTLTGLTANSIYEYRLRTDCDATGLSYSAYTAIQTFATALRIGAEVYNENSKMTVSPNPTNGMVTLKFTAAEKQNSELTVTDITGREVMKQQITISEGENEISVDMNHLVKGVYLMRMKTTGGESVTKIVKE